MLLYDNNAPRTIVRVQGTPVVPKNWTINKNGNGALDTATVALPINGNPDWCAQVKAGQSLEVRIYAGFPADPDPGAFSYAQLSQRFAGSADPIQASFHDDECTLQCNDFAAILARTKTTTNLGVMGFNVSLASTTTVDYLERVAKAHNFTTNIVTAPGFQPASIQQVMAHEQVVGLHAIRIWDLLKYCADTDGVFLWSSNGVINYVDPDYLKRPYIYLEWQNGIASPETAEVQHSPEFSKDVEVEVRSYIPRQRVAHRSRVGSRTDSDGNTVQVWRQTSTSSMTYENFGQPGSVSSSTEYFDGGSSNGSTTTGSYTSTGSSISVGGPADTGYTSTPTESEKVKYIFTLPNATLAQCQAYSMTKWKEISAHEYSMTFSLPITQERLENLDITTKFEFHGLPWGTSNQGYIAKRLTEKFDVATNGGYTADVVGINHRLPFGAV